MELSGELKAPIALPPWKFPGIHDLGIRWGWVVNLKRRSLYHPESSLVSIGQKPIWTPEPVRVVLEKRKSLALAGIRTPDRPAPSESIPATFSRLPFSVPDLSKVADVTFFFVFVWTGCQQCMGVTIKHVKLWINVNLPHWKLIWFEDYRD